MIEQKKDAPGNPPYWVCTNCKWAFAALHEANKHQCSGQTPKDYRYHIKEPQISFNSQVVGHIEPQSKWVGLTDDDKVLIKHDANFNQFMTAGEYADRVQELTEARLKDKNNV